MRRKAAATFWMHVLVWDLRFSIASMANVFLEPSTRTASSFNAAFSRLGGKVITIQEGTSSTKKGETLQDTMRCVECYSDVLVLRHPETGAAKLAAKFVKKPCNVNWFI